MIFITACNTAPVTSSTTAPSDAATPTSSITQTRTAPEGTQTVTILVDSGYKPYSYGEDGVAKGMYIEVLRTVFSRMEGYEVTMEPVPWTRGKQLMEHGQGFGLTPVFFHGHDWPYLYPYSLPFYTETIIAICGETVFSQPRLNWPDDYVGLRIGNVTGFDGWGGEAFYELVEKGEIIYEEAQTVDMHLLKLITQRVDCIMMEERSFDYEFRKINQSGLYDDPEKYVPVQKGSIIGSDPVYIGYSKPASENGLYPFEDDFKQKFDSVLYQMLKSGEVSEIMDAYQD